MNALEKKPQNKQDLSKRIDELTKEVESTRLILRFVLLQVQDIIKKDQKKIKEFSEFPS